MDREKVLEIYKEVVDSIGDIKLKGKTLPYTSANGYMYSQLNKEGQLGIRLPKSEAESFIEKYGAEEFKSYGSVMDEYVKVPDKLLSQPQVIAEYLIKGYDHVMTLPEK
ncbi:MAG: hypothetical protein ACFHWX_17330 [Bacteroidota bacterium]